MIKPCEIRILKRILNIPNDINVSYVKIKNNKNPILKIFISIKDQEFELIFKDREIIISKIINRRVHKESTDLNQLEKENQETNDFNLSEIKKALNSEAILSNSLSKIVINEKQYREDYYDIKLIFLLKFELKKDVNIIIEEIRKELIEYNIRNHVFIETGMIIEENMKNFISAFMATNCKTPFCPIEVKGVDSKNFISEEFKNFINFTNKKELEEVSELLDVNFAI